jgi:protein ImuA
MPAIAREDLKRRISAIESPIAPENGVNFATGCDEIDKYLPSSGFAAGALHEIQCASYGDRAASLGVALALCTRLLTEKPGPVIWCQLRDPDRLHLHAPGLMGLGIDPGRVTKITLRKEQDLLWAIEEALDCAYVAGVVGVLWSEKLYDFTASRRLALRAKKSGVSAFVVRSHWANGTTAADTRWCISSAQSKAPRTGHAFLPRLGKAQWRLDMTKCKGAKPCAWNVVWDHEALRFDLAARLADRADLPPCRPAAAFRQTG